MDDKNRLISEGRPSKTTSENSTSNGNFANYRPISAGRPNQSAGRARPNGYNKTYNPNVGSTRPADVLRRNNYRRPTSITPPSYNYNNDSINENEETESRISQTRRKVEDVSGKVVKVKKAISFFSKYKFIIIGIAIAVTLVILFMFLMMVMELDGDEDSDSGNLSNPSSTYLANVYDECKSISVIGEDKLYDLEEYVAGVVTDENIISLADIEALKAHAIAARTYAIDRTNNCQVPIDNSSNAQNFTSNIADKARQAVNETAGIVLTYDGKIFDSEYDSYCYKDSRCPDSTCDGDTCAVTYTKKPNGETHKISISTSWKKHFVPAAGHARGMSQLVAYQMAKEGSNYEEILKFFYSPGVELSQLSNKSSGINSNITLLPFKVRDKAPTSSDWAWSGDYYGNNVGQCVWYTKGRMIEIINEAVSDEDKKKTSIDVINSTYGNACAWYNQSLLNTFGGSNNVNDYRAGSLIVWKYSGSECNYNNNYGHVAIIEKISDDGKVTITEGYAEGGNSCPDTWDCVRFVSRTFNSTEEFTNWVKNYTNASGTKYDFLGYIHTLG